jgi:hypothetical protein
MSLPTTQEILNYFLYGVSQTPSNLADEGIIDHQNSLIEVDINEYMDIGPGRFISPVDFDIINEFFSSERELDQGIYSLESIQRHLEINQGGVRIQQYNFDDGQDNYVERVFVWNSTVFELEASEIRFVVDEEGNRYIDNFSIIPNRLSENFDLISNDGVAAFGNQHVLIPSIDPNNIGR